MSRLTRVAINTEELLRRVTVPAAGAVVLFLGTVRELTAGRRTPSAPIFAFPRMEARREPRSRTH